MIRLILCLPILLIDIVFSCYGGIVSFLLWNDKYMPAVGDEVDMFLLTKKFFSKDGFRF